ncbi:MAG: hypothetical protein IT324_33460 [Anaerolineae bacterium]|nr:hypothetical protein [Anaerolineae bacterium]
MTASSNSDLPLLTDDAPPKEVSPNGISRRTVIKAGWMVPTVVALDLSGVKLAFTTSNPGGGGGNPPVSCDCTAKYWRDNPNDWPAPYNASSLVSQLFSAPVNTALASWYGSGYSTLTCLAALGYVGIDPYRNFLKEVVRVLLCLKKAGSYAFGWDAWYEDYEKVKHGVSFKTSINADQFINAVDAFLVDLSQIKDQKTKVFGITVTIRAADIRKAVLAVIIPFLMATKITVICASPN